MQRHDIMWTETLVLLYVIHHQVAVIDDIRYHDEQYGDIIITVRKHEVVM